jgi:acyl-CoA thioesterase-2
MTEAARAAAADPGARTSGVVPMSADGIPHGQPVLDRLVALLDLERIEENIFRGVSPA